MGPATREGPRGRSVAARSTCPGHAGPTTAPPIQERVPTLGTVAGLAGVRGRSRPPALGPAKLAWSSSPASRAGAGGWVLTTTPRRRGRAGRERSRRDRPTPARRRRDGGRRVVPPPPSPRIRMRPRPPRRARRRRDPPGAGSRRGRRKGGAGGRGRGNLGRAVDRASTPPGGASPGRRPHPWHATKTPPAGGEKKAPKGASLLYLILKG